MPQSRIHKGGQDGVHRLNFYQIWNIRPGQGEWSAFHWPLEIEISGRLGNRRYVQSVES